MSKPEGKQRLEQAYNGMLERIRHTLDSADHKTRPRLEHAIESARKAAVEWGEITREEANWISAYVRRDLRDMADYANKTGNEYRSWLYMDLELIEANLFGLMTDIADKTRIELDQLSRQANTYHTGEIAGPGTLSCTHCDKHLKFTRSGHIPPCPECRGSEFVRVSE